MPLTREDLDLYGDEPWWSDRDAPKLAPVSPGDLVVHLPEDERAAAVEYQRAGLPYYPSDEDGL